MVDNVGKRGRDAGKAGTLRTQKTGKGISEKWETKDMERKRERKRHFG